MEPTLKQIIAFLVMLAGALGAVLTFFLSLPPSEIILSVIGTITIVIAIIWAAVKMLRELENTVEREVVKIQNRRR